MMELLAFSVFDKAVHAFMTPFFARAKGEAIRSFMEAANDEKHNFSRHASDYTLFYLGVFDDRSGVFSPEVDPERVMSALEAFEGPARGTDAEELSKRAVGLSGNGR